MDTPWVKAKICSYKSPSTGSCALIFRFSRVAGASNGGLLLVRELDERLGLTGLIQNHLVVELGELVMPMCSRVSNPRLLRIGWSMSTGGGKCSARHFP